MPEGGEGGEEGRKEGEGGREGREGGRRGRKGGEGGRKEREERRGGREEGEGGREGQRERGRKMRSHSESEKQLAAQTTPFIEQGRFCNNQVVPTAQSVYRHVSILLPNLLLLYNTPSCVLHNSCVLHSWY